MNTKETELKPHVQRKTIWKIIDQVAETIKQPETESELKKQLLGNIQTQNSYDHVTQG